MPSLGAVWEGSEQTISIVLHGCLMVVEIEKVLKWNIIHDSMSDSPCDCLYAG